MHACIVRTYLEAADVVCGPVGAVEVVGGLDGVGGGAGADEDVAHEGDAGVDERRHAVRPEQAQVPRDDGAPVVTHHEHLRTKTSGSENPPTLNLISLRR